MQIDTSFPSPTPPALGESSDEPLAASPQGQRPCARWRWWVHLCIIASFPIASSVMALFRFSEGQLQLPSSVGKLLLFCVLEVGVFGAFWVLAWAFSRATKDELWLRWREGIRPPLTGFFYAVGLKFGTVAILMFAFAVTSVVFLALGSDVEHAIKFFNQSQPQTEGLLNSVRDNTDPLYRFLLITLLSFGVAGGREELWRVATMAGILKVCPARWTPRLRNEVAVIAAAIIFGLGHAYQGWAGVILTTFLGVALGAMTLRHRSVWPAVIAHGFYDAHSFYLAINLLK